MARLSYIIFVLWLFCYTLFPGAEHAYAENNIIIIANSEVADETLDPDKIKNIFLGEIIRWENGGMITVVILEDDDTHKSFLKKYIRRTTQQFERTWRRNIFSGKGTYPKKLNSNKDLVAYISKTKGAIGYTTSDTVLVGDVKVLAE